VTQLGVVVGIAAMPGSALCNALARRLEQAHSARHCASHSDRQYFGCKDDFALGVAGR